MPLNILIYEIPAIYGAVFASDLLRYAIGAGGVYLAVNCLLVGRLSDRKIRPQSPPKGQIVRELAASLRTIIIFAANGCAIVLGAKLGILTIYADVSDYGWVYFLFSTLILIAAHDTWFYWTHRFMHRPTLFRSFHGLHHKSVHPTPFTSYRFDIAEAVINAAYLPLILWVLPVHPIALFIFTGHMILRNAIGHCGFEIFPADSRGRPYIGWLTTVTHHDLHHAHAPYNFGLYFTWWDRWMGTEHPDYPARYAAAAPRFGRSTPTSRTGTVMAVAIALTFATMPATSGRAEAEALTGTYVSPGIGIAVTFGPCPAAPQTFCGRLRWAWAPPEQSVALPGAIIIRGLRWDGNGWSGGTLLNPENGDTYRGSVARPDTDTLRLEGCFGPFCRSQTWRSLHSVRQLAGLLAETTDE